MDATQKMLQAIIHGQNTIKQELVGKIDKLGEKLSGRIDSLENRIDRVEKNLTNRIDKNLSSAHFLRHYSVTS